MEAPFESFEMCIVQLIKVIACWPDVPVIYLFGSLPDVESCMLELFIYVHSQARMLHEAVNNDTFMQC